MEYSRAWGKLIHEKNLKSKISWHCPFKQSFFCHSMGQTSLDMKSHHQQQQHSQQREVEHSSSNISAHSQQQQQEEEGGVQQQLVRPPEHSPAYMEHSLYPTDKKGKNPP
jgi:hypothetical protein